MSGNLKRERARRGLTLQDLGRLAGMAPSTISRIEQGRRAPKADTRAALARALDIPVSALFGTIAESESAEDIPPDLRRLAAAILRLVLDGDRQGAIEAADRLTAQLAGAELYALCGRVEQHLDLTLNAACDAHAQLLAAYQSLSGELTPGFVDLIAQLRLTSLTSAYDDDIRFRVVAPSTGVVDERVRPAAIGRHVFEIPLVPGYAQLVDADLRGALADGVPRLSYVVLQQGAQTLVYDRIAVPFPRSHLVLGIPLLRARR